MMDVDIAQVEKHYRGMVFLGTGAFSGVMFLGRLFRYEDWRGTGASLLFLLMLGAIVWGVFGYARIANRRGGYLYGSQKQMAIIVCAVPVVVVLLIAIAAFLL